MRNLRIILTVLFGVALVVITFGVAQHYAESKKAAERTHAPQVVKSECPRSDYTYVQTNGLVLKLPRGVVLQNVEKPQGCNTQDNPIIVNKFSSDHNYITLKGWYAPLKFQFSFGERRDWLAEVKQDLTARGQTIEDLPRQGSFYVYQKVMGKTVFSPYYLGAVRNLRGSDGQPVVLWSCAQRCCDCAPVFRWRGLRVSANLPARDLCWEKQEVDVEEWATIFPLIVNYLDSLVVSVGSEEKN